MNPVKQKCLAALNGSKQFGQLNIDDLGAQIIHGARLTTYLYGAESFSEPVTKADEAAKIHDDLLAGPSTADLKGLIHV